MSSGRLPGCCYLVLGAQALFSLQITLLAVSTVAPDFRAGNLDLEPELGFNLLFHLLQWISEILHYGTTAHTDDMSMFLLQAGFIVMLLTFVMHQIQFINQALFFQHFQSAIYSYTVDLGVFFLGQCEQLIGIQVCMRVVDQPE